MDLPICRLDFDGVIHSYRTPNHPWNPEFIPDPVTPGFWPWAVKAQSFFKLVIFSSRCETAPGREAIRRYLGQAWREWVSTDEGQRVIQTMNPGREKALDFLLMVPFGIVDHPVPAFVTIDDRAITFQGDWTELDPETLRAFQPWNKRRSLAGPI